MALLLRPRQLPSGKKWFQLICQAPPYLNAKIFSHFLNVSHFFCLVFLATVHHRSVCVAKHIKREIGKIQILENFSHLNENETTTSPMFRMLCRNVCHFALFSLARLLSFRCIFVSSKQSSMSFYGSFSQNFPFFSACCF